MSESVLIVEDEASLAELMAAYLQKEQLSSHTIGRGDEVLSWLKSHQPQVIIMDLMLPGQDGLSLTQQIRTFSEVPIIITTAKVAEIDRLLGLEIGADDYVCKPYSPRELVARVKVQLRRHSGINQHNNEDIKLNPDQLSVRYGEKKIQLTTVEFNMLQALYQANARVLSRDQLMNRAYSDYRIISDRTIDSHIKKIRKKLQKLDDRDFIQSVYGLGYQYIG